MTYFLVLLKGIWNVSTKLAKKNSSAIIQFIIKIAMCNSCLEQFLIDE